MKTILVATDFSATATNAANYTADMALTLNAKILLLHVYQIPVVYLEVPVVVTEEDLSRDAEKQINKLKMDLEGRTHHQFLIETELRMGVFFTELKMVCERVKPYAVVMGSQGSTIAERFLFGGHAVYTMKHLTWPVITVPAGVNFASVKKIGLAFDFSNLGDTMPLDEIKMLLRDFHAELHVLNTGKESEFDPDIVFKSSLLEEMLEPYKPNYHFIANDDIDQGIVDFAEKNDIDLLLVLPKRHSLMDRLIHKSHSKQMVLHSHVPVMVLHQ